MMAQHYFQAVPQLVPTWMTPPKRPVDPRKRTTGSVKLNGLPPKPAHSPRESAQPPWEEMGRPSVDAHPPPSLVTGASMTGANALTQPLGRLLAGRHEQREPRAHLVPSTTLAHVQASPNQEPAC